MGLADHRECQWIVIRIDGPGWVTVRLLDLNGNRADDVSCSFANKKKVEGSIGAIASQPYIKFRRLTGLEIFDRTGSLDLYGRVGCDDVDVQSSRLQELTYGAGQLGRLLGGAVTIEEEGQRLVRLD